MSATPATLPGSAELAKAAASAAIPLLKIDPALFRADFGDRPFRIRHRLASHELFALPRLIELARTLPRASVEYNAGNVGVTLDPTQTPHTGLSPEETIRRIEECQSWLVLKNVEQDAEYEALLDACLHEVEILGDPAAVGVCQREGFVFISSPGSVTPYHVDPEQNFLLQVRGTKTIYVYDGASKVVLSEEELERFYAGGHRNQVHKEAYEDHGQGFDLKPADGVHVPLTHPHWVKNGGAVSISFSITFKTAATERRAALYAVNHNLRQRGWKPVPVGASPFRDGLKYNGYRLLRRLGLAGNKQQPGAMGGVTT